MKRRIFWSLVLLVSGLLLAGAVSSPISPFVREGADTFGVKRGVNPQTVNVYNTFTDDSNYERFRVGWLGNDLVLQTQAAGAGVLRMLKLNGVSLSFQTGNVGRWNMDAAGNLIAVTDNVNDIGASGANRPRNLYLAGSLLSGSVPLARLEGFTGSAVIDFASIPANSVVSSVIPVTGVVFGDFVSLSFSSEPEVSIVFRAYVSAADNVRIVASNILTSAVDPLSRTYYVKVLKKDF